MLRGSDRKQTLQRRVAQGTLALALALAWGASGCGKDGKNPTDPGGGGGGSDLPAEASGLASIPGAYVEATAPAFTSIEFFAPYLAAAIATPAPQPAMPAHHAPAAPSVTCFSGTIAGATYEWNGAAFARAAVSSAPSNGVRFILPEVVAGAPTSNVIGHIQMTCEAVGTTELKDVTVSIVVNGFTVYAAYGRYDPARPELILQGDLASPSHGVVLETFVTAETQSTRSSLSMIYPGWQFGTDEGPGGARTMRAYGISISPDLNVRPSWAMYLTLDGDASGAITSGTGVFDPDLAGVALQLAACVSGTFDDITVQGAISGGCTAENATPVRFSVGSLSVMESGYEMLRAVHVSLGGLVRLVAQVSAAA